MSTGGLAQPEWPPCSILLLPATGPGRITASLPQLSFTLLQNRFGSLLEVVSATSTPSLNAQLPLVRVQAARIRDALKKGGRRRYLGNLVAVFDKIWAQDGAP